LAVTINDIIMMFLNEIIQNCHLKGQKHRKSPLLSGIQLITEHNIN